MKIFRVCYTGLHLGGEAVVVANDAEEAKQLVKEDANTISFDDVSIEEEIELKKIKPRVILNNTGDY